MPSSTKSEPNSAEPEPERRGDASPVPEEEPSLSGPSASTDPGSMARLLSEMTAQLQAQFAAKEAELKSQFEAARAAVEAERARAAASARLELLPPDRPPMVTVEEATAVVHSREHLAEQEILVRDAEIAHTRMQAEMDRRRIETEG